MPGECSKRILGTGKYTSCYLVESELGNTSRLVGAFKDRIGAVHGNYFGARPAAGDNVTDRPLGAVEESPIFVCFLYAKDSWFDVIV